MFKLIIYMAFFACGCPLFAQVTLFSEDFDGVGGNVSGGAGTFAFPTGWTLINHDGLTPNASVAYVNDAWERREDFSFNASDSCAFSTSWYNPTGQADDWMITPAIYIPSATSLSWNAVTYDVSFRDGYQVWVGSAPTVAAMTSGTQVFSIGAENTAWTARSASMAAFAGQTIYIGFRNNSTDKFLLLIDDISVISTNPNIDLAMQTPQRPSQYNIMPSAQITPLLFAGTVRNEGTTAAAAARFQVRVKKDGLLVHNGLSNSVASLLPSTTSPTLFATSYTPSGVGSYEVEYIAKTFSEDVAPSNDTLRYFLTVDDYTYARDSSDIIGSLGIGGNNGGYLGQQFDVPNNGTVGSVSVYYTKGYSNNEPLGVAVWDMADGAPNSIIAETVPTTYYQGQGGALYVLPFSDPLSLSPETYVFTSIEYDSTLALGITNQIFTTGTGWVDWPTNPFNRWANVEEFGASFSHPFAIRPNFCPNNLSASVAEVDYTCFSSGMLTANLEGAQMPYTYAWSNGATTQSISPAIGNYTLTITDAYYCKWLASGTLSYEYTLAVDDTPIGAGNYRATLSITSQGTVTSAASPVLFEASEQISLLPGFHAQAGSTFTARIRECSPLNTAVPEETNTAAQPATTETRPSAATQAAAASPSGLEVRVVPNPMGDMATIRYFLPEGGWVRISLHDVNGRDVLTLPMAQGAAGWQELPLDATNLPRGFYLLSVASETDRKVTKIVVAR